MPEREFVIKVGPVAPKMPRERVQEMIDTAVAKAASKAAADAMKAVAAKATPPPQKQMVAVYDRGNPQDSIAIAAMDMTLKASVNPTVAQIAQYGGGDTGLLGFLRARRALEKQSNAS